MDEEPRVENGRQRRPSSSKPSVNHISRPDDHRLRSLSAAAVKTGSNEENVRVIVRVRPLSKKEEQKGSSDIVDIEQSTNTVTVNNPDTSSGAKKTFRFDHVLGTESTQAEVFNQVARPIIQNVIQGYNGTIFAYGQTGTGKTFTMEGDRGVPELRGIIPNSFAQIFSHIAQESETSKFLVRVSYLEIYNEDVRDLLGKDALQKMEIKEKPGTGVYVKNLSSFIVRTEKDMEKILKIGNKNRVVGSTNMNTQSSRSHAIFSINVECGKDIGGEHTLRMGKLNLVDLAGSERVSKTGATGQRLKEGAKINLSLSALGNVIAALVEGQQHIPYRSSKLTRLLQDSLGGNSKTVMIANIGPAAYNYEETISTLRYADRAKQIKNNARINEDPKDALLRQFEKEIEELRLQLAQQGDVPSKTKRRSSKRLDDDEGSTPLSMADEDTIREIKGELEATQRLSSLAKEAAEEKKRALMALKENVLTWKQQQERKAALEEKLKILENKIMVGGENLLEKSQRQEEFLQKSMKELQERRKNQIVLQASLDLKIARKAELEKRVLAKHVALRDIRRQTRAFLRTLQKEEMEDGPAMQEEDGERDALTAEIHRFQVMNQDAEQIINYFVPQRHLKLIKKSGDWNDETGTWDIPCIAYAGNHVEHVTTFNSPLERDRRNETTDLEFLYKSFDSPYGPAGGDKTCKGYIDAPPARISDTFTEEELNRIIDEYYTGGPQPKPRSGVVKMGAEERSSDSESDMEVYDFAEEQ